MFYYFGFGSNISMVSLKAKGVTPIDSQKAVLSGWTLRFNVEHFFRNEGGVGNIEYTGDPNDKVLGVIHKCQDDALEPLDATEAYGYGYNRISLDVDVIDNANQPIETISALTYVGMPDFIDNNCLPSQRYLNIIVEGAVQANLDKEYIAKLKAHAVHKPKDYPRYSAPAGKHPSFDIDSLAKFPQYTALYGAVFDMSKARQHHDYLKIFFGGQDMTLFHLKRMDSSYGNETLEDIKYNKLDSRQKVYLNSFLNEYAVEYRYVGNYNY